MMCRRFQRNRFWNTYSPARTLSFIVLIALTLFSGCPNTSPRAFGLSANMHLHHVRVKKLIQPYILFIPDGYNPSTPVPLLLYWHGLTQSGTDGIGPVTQALGPVLIDHPELFPFLVALPQLPRFETHDTYEEEFDLVLEEIQENYLIDPKRIYVTGASTGGGHALQYVANHPGEFAAVIPVAASVGPEYVPSLLDIPIYAFQGTDDRAHHVEDMRAFVDEIEMGGGNISYKEFPGANHDIFTQVYSDPDVIDWLLAQSLSK